VIQGFSKNQRLFPVISNIFIEVEAFHYKCEIFVKITRHFGRRFQRGFINISGAISKISRLFEDISLELRFFKNISRLMEVFFH
jgi:predicted butyrate kinase (DUF1464 family)